MKEIVVLGAGTWGMALAKTLSNNGHQVTVWSALPEEIESYKKTRVQPNLPGMVIPEEIEFTADLAEGCKGKDILLYAVPSVFIRRTAEAAAPLYEDGQIIVTVAKGIEHGTLMTMSQIIEEEYKKAGKDHNLKTVALSGPTHAEEVAFDLPTAIVSASEDMEAAETIQDLFDGSNLRAYTNPDINGVELCGAIKNVIALAVGISKGLGFGDNARAALITRGMEEIKRLGTAMGCHPLTFSGLAGIGDLIVTASSEHSRNNRCGQLIGKGMSPEAASKEVGMVVEGLNALPAVMEMAEKFNVEVPISSMVYEIVENGMPAKNAAKLLMGREKRAEFTGSLEPGSY